MHEFINMHGGYYFSLLEEMQRGEPSEIRETQFRSCNCPGTTLKHQDFVPLLLGPHGLFSHVPQTRPGTASAAIKHPFFGTWTSETTATVMAKRYRLWPCRNRPREGP